MTHSDCIFCKVIAGQVPSYKVYEDAQCYVFLDIFPLRPGHVLVIPKYHEPDFWQLEEEIYQHCMGIAKGLAKHMKAILEVKRVGMIITGFDVPHVHIHLIPLNSEKELTAQSLKALNLPYPSSAELTEMADRLKVEINS